jgi:acyl carrier protein
VTELADVVAAVLGLDPAGIADTDGPSTLDRWTSLRHIELVVAVEEVYEVSLGREAIVGVRSIGDLREALRRKGVRL